MRSVKTRSFKYFDHDRFHIENVKKKLNCFNGEKSTLEKSFHFKRFSSSFILVSVVNDYADKRFFENEKYLRKNCFCLFIWGAGGVFFSVENLVTLSL